MAAILPLCGCSSTSTVFPHSFIPFSPLFPNKTHKITPPTLLFSASPTSVSFIQGRTGFSVSGSRRTKTNNDAVEMDGEDEFGDADDETPEDNSFVLPFGEMTKWFRNKPPGFGEGKVYDTSLEEKLLGEIEQSSRAQLANINKLQNNPKMSTPKKQEQEAIEDFSGRIHVRLGNLPKKKNIQRDLQLAFKGFPGIVNISPAVSGNKKTRDPVCKGFAFVYFESEEAAHRFTEVYSKQDIKFGKIQKQIRFEIKNPKHTPNSACTYISSPQLSFLNMESETDVGSDGDAVLYDSEEETTEGSVGVAVTSTIEISKELTYSTETESMFSESEEIDGGIEDIEISKPNGKQGAINVESLPSKQKQKGSAGQKKKTDKKRSEKISRLNVPGSANRLKIKERAVLTGVFSKYGEKADLTSSR